MSSYISLKENNYCLENALIIVKNSIKDVEMASSNSLFMYPNTNLKDIFDIKINENMHNVIIEYNNNEYIGINLNEKIVLSEVV